MNSVMDRIEVALGEFPLEGEPYTAMVATDRQAIVDLLDETKSLHGENGYFDIAMPCGYSKKFEVYANIPLEDLPCPCGRRGRYLIRYKKENI